MTDLQADALTVAVDEALAVLEANPEHYSIEIWQGALIRRDRKIRPQPDRYAFCRCRDDRQVLLSPTCSALLRAASWPRAWLIEGKDTEMPLV